MSEAKSIWIEWRNPITKHEHKLCGQSVFTNPSTARVFINQKKNRVGSEEIKTFWHEMVHVFLHFHNVGKKLTLAQEEDLCRRIETIMWEVLR